DGRCRVQNIVRAGDIQTKTAQVRSAMLDLELAAHRNCGAPDNTQVRLRALSVSDRSPVYVRQNLLNVFVIQAQDGRAIERDLADELLKCRANLFNAGVMIQFFAIDIGDDGENWRELEEGTIAFITFNHKVVALAQPGVGAAHHAHAPANHESWVE